MKRKLKRLFLPLLVLVGLALLLYPQLSDLWNRRTNSVALSGYSKTIREMSDKDYSDVFTAAREYNEELRQMGGYILSEEMQERYYSLLIRNSDIQSANIAPVKYLAEIINIR